MCADATPLSVLLAQPGPIPLDVAFDIAPGELLALIGPSGSGKTTVLRSIAGLYHPRRGRIRADGEVWLDTEAGVDLSPQARRVGLVFQDYALFPHLSTLDNVRLAMLHLPEPQRRRQATDLLARVHLEGLEARRPDQLSGGQRQRVALARALARDPRVLLLDEPFSAVDRGTRETLKDELAGLHRAFDIPMVLVTHDIDEAQALASRICVLDAGKTLQIGTPDDVRLHPKNTRVARLMGQHNLLSATVEGDGHIRCGDASIAVSRLNGCRPGDRITALLPPDGISIAGVEPASGNVVQGIVTGLQPLGDLAVLTLDLGDGSVRFRISARDAAARALRVGAPLGIRLDPTAIHVIHDD